MNTILVAVDIARHGGNDTVISTAKRIAEQFGGEVTLVHALESFQAHIAAEMPEGVLAKREQEARQAAEALAADHGLAGCIVRDGAPAKVILETASERQADLIVIHSHDPDLTDYFLGSVAGRVVRHAHCSVHVVREAKA